MRSFESACTYPKGKCPLPFGSGSHVNRTMGQTISGRAPALSAFGEKRRF